MRSTAGLGSLKVADVADSACPARGDAQVVCGHLADSPLGSLGARQSLRGSARLCPATILGERGIDKLTQTRLAKNALDSKLGRWQTWVGPADRTRCKAFAAKCAAYLYDVVPSMILDARLRSAVLATNVALRLRVDVVDAGQPCRLCGAMLEGGGVCTQSCMADEDAILEHTAVRDVFVDYAGRSGLRPVAEAPGILTAEGAGPCRDRSADVLVIAHLAFARQLPDGSRAVRAERVCLDVAVVHALGPGHRPPPEQRDKQRRRKPTTWQGEPGKTRKRGARRRDSCMIRPSSSTGAGQQGAPMRP